VKTKKIKNRYTNTDVIFRRMFFTYFGDIEDYEFTFGHQVDEVFGHVYKRKLIERWKIMGHNVMIGFDYR
jgi:hypothetical protein